MTSGLFNVRNLLWLPFLLEAGLLPTSLLCFVRGSRLGAATRNVELLSGDDGCLTSVDCSMNGECVRTPPNDDVQVPGHCQCFSGWIGSRCEVLDLLPVNPRLRGLQLADNASTWGGSVIYRNGNYHMFASEMVLNCGLEYWTTNSQVIHAVSKLPYGPYQKIQVILPTFAHDTNVLQAPNGDVVLLVTALANVTPVDCRNGQTPPISSMEGVPPKDTYMLWAPHPLGPWSEPQLVLNSTIWNSDYWAKYHRVAKCDSNLNGIILPDNSFLGLWRRCETPNLLTIPHTLSASNWKEPSTYLPNVDPLFVLGGSGAEDPSNIWTTNTSDMGLAYHAMLHDEQATRCMKGQCSASGRHAFSLDGKAWSYGRTNAYDRTVMFKDGTNMTIDTRARPHLIMDKHSNDIIALSTGIQPHQDSGYVWTLVQPVRKRQGNHNLESAATSG